MNGIQILSVLLVSSVQLFKFFFFFTFERERQSVSRGGAERVGDIESEAGSGI